MIIRSDDTKINWRATGRDRIIQNVHNLIRLWAGEVPYDRDMGLDRTLLHAPGNRVALLENNIAEVIAKYEPRAIVNRITVILDEEGNFVSEVDLT